MRTVSVLTFICALTLAACGDGDSNDGDVGATTDVPSDSADAAGDGTDDAAEPEVDASPLPDAIDDGDDGGDDVEVADADVADDTDADDADAEDADAVDAPEPFVQPEPTDEARARAFRLFYRERTDRVLVAYNRFAVFGDATFAIAVDKAHVSREGDHFDIVVGPNDNNLIGTPLRAVWHAYRHLGTRTAELTLIRMLRGLLFFEAVTGYPGTTSRMALPGWTLDIDGTTGAVSRSRDDVAVTSPLGNDPDLEAEIVATFFDGLSWRYRMDPQDFMLTFYPGIDPGEYAVTISIPNLPHFIRVSDCCATLFHTPEGHDWSGAWWSNHNSRDNYPDLAMGFLSALEALEWDESPESIRDLAEEVLEAGARIFDLVEASDGNVMTFDEYNEYGTHVVSGARRPHGLPENENLGGMASCPMALLNRALSSEPLETEPEDVWLPGTPEHLITPAIASIIDCPFEEPRRCVSIDDAWCGHTWSTIDNLQVLGQSWLDLGRTMEAANPGSSGTLFGAFQNDYDDVVEAMMTLIATLDLQGRTDLAARARFALGHMTDLMRDFADIIYGSAAPERTVAQRYEAAIFDALAGVEVVEADLGDFAIEEARLARIEALLDFGETSPRRLFTDDEIRERIETRLAGLSDGPGPGRSDAVRQRYADTYPDGEPPIRRAGDAYEARQGSGPWVPAERPRHTTVGGLDLLQAIALCSTSPYLLDCSWAALGCAAPDLDDSGAVDESDRLLLEAAFETFGEGASCPDPGDCGGADLDRSGTLDASDRAFMEAAMGCVR